MIANYFKLALRNLLKRKGYSFLNIMGLAIGITCCLLIFQYVAFERSFDSFGKKQARLFAFGWTPIARENSPGSRQLLILHSVRP